MRLNFQETSKLFKGILSCLNSFIINMHVYMEELFILSSVFMLGMILSRVSSDPVKDRGALLDFVNNIPHSRILNWNPNSSVCINWTGVTCSHDHSRVISLRLPEYGFRGPIPGRTLSRLSDIQILSLESNGFSGTFPTDFVRFENLTALYLQSNNFTGPLPNNLSSWKKLSTLILSNNSFIGSIPSSISNLSQLVVLDLSFNSFSGEIQDIHIPGLQQLNLSNNNLSGNVPISFQRFPISSFVGNHDLLYTYSNFPTQSVSRRVKKISEPAILGIVISGCAIMFAALVVSMAVCCSNEEKKHRLSQKIENRELNSKKMIPEIEHGNNKLVFFDGCDLAFDLEDLLRASAEILGKGMFGMTYKVALEDTALVVVKRLRDVTVTKREFEQNLEVFGHVKHENVTPLRAYYYSKDEKLVMYDYYTQGSVSAMLHGKRIDRWTPLDWESRLRIVIGTARGISHLHKQNGGKMVHGNIKASNIFLNSHKYGCVSDFSLVVLMGPISPSTMKSIGYWAPEVIDLQITSQASDVYSFGVFILELLTGKSPTNSKGVGDEMIHIVKWVHSVVREEWTAEVFDLELLRFPNIEEEMVELLKIGLACVVGIPEQRPKMHKIVDMVEDIRRLGMGNRPSLDHFVSTQK